MKTNPKNTGDMTKKPLKIFFVGKSIDFDSKSGSWMNNLYEVGTKNRLTWGDADVALKEGRTVSARPATPKEMLWAYKKLAAIQADNARRLRERA